MGEQKSITTTLKLDLFKFDWREIKIVPIYYSSVVFFFKWFQVS